MWQQQTPESLHIAVITILVNRSMQYAKYCFYKCNTSVNVFLQITQQNEN